MAASSQAEAAARPAPALRLPLAWRLAGRELRGGITGFRLFLFCLALGAALIARETGLDSLCHGADAGDQGGAEGETEKEQAESRDAAAQLAPRQPPGQR